MGRISNEEFHRHQAYLGSGYAALVEVESVVGSGLALVVASEDIQVELDMLDAYNENYGQVQLQATSSLLRIATLALENHITERTGQTFNDFLYLNGLKVNQDFADLSELLGVPIDPLNIE
jgi:hypothetical protein